MSIYIENLQNIINVKDERNNINDIINKVIFIVLKKENFKLKYEVSILLVDNEEITKINFEQRNINISTDVLSFPIVSMKNGIIISDEGDFDLEENELLLGDIIISLEKAKEQAIEYGHSFEREIAFLVTHGMLHILGYDHENAEDEKIMLKKQEYVLSQLKLSR